MIRFKRAEARPLGDRMRLAFPFFCCWLVSAAAAPAIVVRHDIADVAYLAREGSFPFLFAMYRGSDGHRDCIATLIDPNWAITAAHCTRDRSFQQALAEPGGRFSVQIGGSSAMVDRVVRYPGTHGRRTADLALLHLFEPVRNVEPASLYRHRDELARIVLLPGWGRTGNGVAGLQASDGRFRVAENRVDAVGEDLLVWEFDDPRRLAGRALPLEGINGPGDSGGPALLMTPQGWSVAGISSGQRTFGRPEGLYGAEEEYVRVSTFVTWIDETMAAN